MLTLTQTDTGGLWGVSRAVSVPTHPSGLWEVALPPGDPSLVTKVHAWLCCSSSCARISWV